MCFHHSRPSHLFGEVKNEDDQRWRWDPMHTGHKHGAKLRKFAKFWSGSFRPIGTTHGWVKRQSIFHGFSATAILIGLQAEEKAEGTTCDGWGAWFKKEFCDAIALDRSSRRIKSRTMRFHPLHNAGSMLVEGSLWRRSGPGSEWASFDKRGVKTMFWVTCCKEAPLTGSRPDLRVCAWRPCALFRSSITHSMAYGE